MSFVDQLGTELAGGTLAGAGALLRDYVLEHRAVLESLGEAGTRRLFELLAQGPAEGNWDQAVEGMGQTEVRALLEVTAGQMAETAERQAQRRAQSRAAAEALLGQLSQVAWRVATEAILAAL